MTARARVRDAGPPPGRGQGRPRPAGPPPLATGLAVARALREAIEGGARVPEALLRATAGLPRNVRTGADRALRRLTGDYPEDEWGFDEEFADALLPAFELLYDVWWRVRAEGLHHVPAHGRALLVANHAGALPWDAAMIATAVLREHPLPRHPRFLAMGRAFELPWVSLGLRKLGAVVAAPQNAIRLLEQEHLVGVFPEGAAGTGKPFAERYRLARFGRGGFVEIALRTGAPIVPVAVVGSEEIYPKVGESRRLARVTGLPFFPLTPTFPALGPLGAVPLPVKWRIEFCEPIETAGLVPEAREDRGVALELAEHVRETIQRKVYENLLKRGPAFI
ncbi:MAG: lysophospholipid acyltransferase family protein [Thermoleophilaceae bacterium]